MFDYEKINSDVKKILSEKRFIHTEGVVKRAIEYAKIYNVETEIVKAVAVTHDIAKEFTEEQNNYYIKKYNIQLDYIEKRNSDLLHQKIGAYICKDKYGFTEDMVNSIRYHTTGRANMSLLEKIIFLADATEENRKYYSKDYVDLVKKDIDSGIIEICKFVINRLLEKNKIIHPYSIECYNYYVNLNSNYIK